jgi:hypothetical protein
MKLGLTVPTLAGIDAATAAVAFTIVRYAEVQAEPVADRSWPDSGRITDVQAAPRRRAFLVEE